MGVSVGNLSSLFPIRENSAKAGCHEKNLGRVWRQYSIIYNVLCGLWSIPVKFLMDPWHTIVSPASATDSKCYFIIILEDINI